MTSLAMAPSILAQRPPYRSAHAPDRPPRAHAVRILSRKLTKSLQRAGKLSFLLGGLLLASCAASPRAAPLPDIAALAEANDWPALRAAEGSLGTSSWSPVLAVSLAAARLDLQTARQVADRALSDPALSAEQRAAILSSLAGVAFARADYDMAAAVAGRWIEQLESSGDTDEVVSARQLQSTAALLAAASPQRLESAGSGEAELWHDKVGLVRARTAIGGRTIEAVLDTGANISVIRRSLAERLGMRFVDGKAAIGSSTLASIDIEVAVADRIAFAGATLHNVAFIVLDDAGLSFPVPGGYDIDAIIGFPVFLALERFAFTHDKFRWGASVPEGGTTALFAHGNDLYIDTLVDGRRVALHLDTGAAHTELTGLFADRYPEYRGEALADRTVSGAGGSTTAKVVKLPTLAVDIGGWVACAKDVDLSLGAPTGIADDHLGRLGQDVLSQAGWFRVDLGQMRAGAGGIAPPVCNQPASDGSAPRS